MAAEEAFRGHVLLCACVVLPRPREGGTVEKASSATESARLSKQETHTHQQGQLRGVALEVTLSALADWLRDVDAEAWPAHALTVRDAPREYVAPWLRDFQPAHVVCAWGMQDAENVACTIIEKGAVVAAAGTIAGHVYLLHASDTTAVVRVVRRFTGPIADLCFLHTIAPSGTPGQERSARVDRLLDTARPVAAATETLALVVLDSVGQIMVLRRLHAEVVRTQSVADVARLFRLPCNRLLPDAAHTTAPQLDPTTLFARDDATCGVQDGRTGHLLSHGLLSLCHGHHYYSGVAEVVVSTMGQALVGVRFDLVQDGFVVQTAMDTPAPVYAVCALRQGNQMRPAVLLLATVKGVLLAEMPRWDEEAVLLQERAAVLHRLLRPQGSVLET